MNRQEYLKQRRLQGLASRIRRAEYQNQRGQKQIDGMKSTFERNKTRHEAAIKRIELRIKQIDDQISVMRQQQAELQ